MVNILFKVFTTNSTRNILMPFFVSFIYFNDKQPHYAYKIIRSIIKYDIQDSKNNVIKIHNTRITRLWNTPHANNYLYFRNVFVSVITT